jgi:hypothetical protein
MSDENIKFEESLGENDYGLIICGDTGMLKGIFIPENLEEEDIPEAIVKICKEYFDIDPNEDVTLH